MLIRKIMEDWATYYLSKYFPQFNRPDKSRFSDFFEELSKQENPNNNEKIIKSLDINISNILLGKDKRSSLIIKGFPSEMRENDILSMLKKFTNNINFFYIPPLIKEQKRYMYAFVNLSNYKSIIPLYFGLINLRDKGKSIFGYDLKEIELYYSKAQGLKTLIKKCRENKE